MLHLSGNSSISADSVKSLGGLRSRSFGGAFERVEGCGECFWKLGKMFK